MVGVAIRKESRQGVSEVNDAVNLLEFFQLNILPELQNLNHASRPVVKATAIKFVCTFRNQFSRDNMVQLLPLLISHLSSNVVVVHTFAAYAVERILVCKEEVAVGTKRPKIGPQELMPLLEPLFNGLFTIIDNVEHNENDYAMKCVMRSLATAKDGIIPVTQIVITKLTAALGRIAKNPRNPQYNHYLFESIAVLVRSVCSKDPNQTAAFEPLLLEPFNIILQMDIAEFTPYVFQVLAQLLEYRPANQGLGQAYTSLFAPILTPMLWEQKGNVPALTRLLQAYVRKAPTELLPHLDRILGVFQKLISAKSTECSAFDLLSVVTTHVPHEAMDPKIGTVFQLLLVRLQGSTKAPRYKKLVTTYFALFVGKYGPQAFVERLEGVQPGLAVMVLEQVWIPRLKTDPPIHQRVETKVHVVGLTKLLFESPVLLADPRAHQVWSHALAGVISLLISPVWRAGTSAAAGASLGHEIDDDDDAVELEIGYDAQFSKLSFASRAPEDFFPEVPDAGLAFSQALHQALAASASSPTPILPLVQTAVNADEKLSDGLVTLMGQAGLGGVGI
jgi:exportin-2 (importin alpha re-exporter)